MTLYRNEIAHADRDEHRYPHTEWDHAHAEYARWGDGVGPDGDETTHG